MTAPPEQPWTRSAQEMVNALDVSTEQGLAEAEIKRRRRQYGPNRLRQSRRRSAWQILIDQFKSLVVWLLVVAAIVALAFGEWVDSIAIAVVVVNAAIGFLTELRAVRSMEALKEIGQVTTKVRRAGQIKEIPAEALVPGDIVIVEGGDVVTADLRLIEASKLQANESALISQIKVISNCSRKGNVCYRPPPLAHCRCGRSNCLYSFFRQIGSALASISSNSEAVTPAKPFNTLGFFFNSA